MDKQTPPSGNPIPAYRRYFVIFAMAGMAVFFCLQALLQPTNLWGWLAILLYIAASVRFVVLMNRGFQRNPPSRDPGRSSDT